MRQLLRSAVYGVADLILSLVIFFIFVSGLLSALIGVYDRDAVFGGLAVMAFSLSGVLFLAKVSSDLVEGHPGGHARVIPIIHE